MLWPIDRLPPYERNQTFELVRLSTELRRLKIVGGRSAGMRFWDRICSTGAFGFSNARVIIHSTANQLLLNCYWKIQFAKIRTEENSIRVGRVRYLPPKVVQIFPGAAVSSFFGSFSSSFVALNYGDVAFYYSAHLATTYCFRLSFDFVVLNLTLSLTLFLQFACSSSNRRYTSFHTTLID